MKKKLKKYTPIIILLLLLLSILLNIRLIGKTESAYKYIDANLSEDMAELYEEVKAIKPLLNTKEANEIGEILYDTCYDTVKKISGYRFLGGVYETVDLREFENVILDLTIMDDAKSIPLKQEKLSALTEIFDAFSELYMASPYDFKEDPLGKLPKLEEINRLCIAYNNL